MPIDHLEEALNYLNASESDGLMDNDVLTRKAIAHALIDIAETLRWFREQKEYDLSHEHDSRLDSILE